MPFGRNGRGTEALVLELYSALPRTVPYPKEAGCVPVGCGEVSGGACRKKHPGFHALEETKEDIGAPLQGKICLWRRSDIGTYSMRALDMTCFWQRSWRQKVEGKIMSAVRTLLAAAFPPKKAEDEWKKNQVKALREEEKAILKELKEKCFSNSGWTFGRNPVLP